VGALTLSNVFGGLGFAWVRHLSMWAATIVWLLYIVKIIRYPKTCAKEYSNPCSLGVFSVLNVIENLAPVLIYFFYVCVLIFPMCIGIVATNKMAGFAGGLGSENLSGMLTQLGGIETYVTTMIVGYVLLMFLCMALRTPGRG
jgi:hypothetical protein